MWLSGPPNNFKQVDPELFQDYLQWCEDYTCDAVSGYHIYTFRWGKRFAYLEFNTGNVFVDGSLLKPQTESNASP